MELLAREALAEGSVDMISKIFDQNLEFVSLEHRLFSLDRPGSYVQYNDPTCPDAQVNAMIVLDLEIERGLLVGGLASDDQRSCFCVVRLGRETRGRPWPQKVFGEHRTHLTQGETRVCLFRFLCHRDTYLSLTAFSFSFVVDTDWRTPGSPYFLSYCITLTSSAAVAGGSLHEEHGQCPFRSLGYRGRGADNPRSSRRTNPNDFRTTEQGAPRLLHPRPGVILSELPAFIPFGRTVLCFSRLPRKRICTSSSFEFVREASMGESFQGRICSSRRCVNEHQLQLLFQCFVVFLDICSLLATT